MQLIKLGNDTYLNLEALALVEPDRRPLGEMKVRVVFGSGTEVRFSGARAEALLGHLETVAREPYPAPGLRTGEDEGL